ncbi:hypothetical protein [Bacillus cereus group sp. BfR-BA-01446]|uniref:hypothetical protein n=1 Tax=Bacillus cereus group sp. BfR-BA-01446 TaxID=2920350 RepID=UPI001F56A2CE|nr:hypothetical protein [Bacillus cereus group sp. BfR-BA-01446]
MKLELGSIIKIYFEEDLYKLYIVSKLHVNDLIGVKYALIGMNGTVYSNMYFSSLENLEIQLKLEYFYEILKINLENVLLREYLKVESELLTISTYSNSLINRNYAAEKAYSTNFSLKSVINKFINNLSGRWGLLIDRRTLKEKAAGNSFRGELLLENKLMFKIEIILISDVKRKEESYWQCKAEIME